LSGTSKGSTEGPFQTESRGIPLLYDIASPRCWRAILQASGHTWQTPRLVDPSSRPPRQSHSCWGFCYFNNIAIPSKETSWRVGKFIIAHPRLRLHYGDGTANTFIGSKEVTLFSARGAESRRLLKDIPTDFRDKERGVIFRFAIFCWDFF